MRNILYTQAAGVDEIVNEILRRPELSDCLLDILNMCYTSKTVPTEWHVSLLVPVFKKGNPSMCTNYRGIALMSTCAKLYNRLLLGRIRDGLDSHLRPNQNGFRPLRSTGQHVLAWRRIHEEVIATKFASLYSTFIDFSKAFDSVDWNYIENIMLSYDIPVETVDAVMSVYYGATAAVKSDGDISDYFDLGVGVLQGDTLAPYLFVLVIDWIMRNAVPDASLGFCVRERVGTRSRCTSPAVYVTDLDFADDIAVLSSSATNMQIMILSIELWALKVGLKINGPKTEYLVSGYEDPLTPAPMFHLSSGLELKKVLDFKYLGTWLISSMNDFKIRRAAAWSAIKKLNNIWKSTAITNHLKIRLFNCLVVSILLYNATTWTMNKTLTKALTGGYNRLLRYALNIHWSLGVHMVTNASVYAENHLQPIASVLRRRRLTFAGHCYRCFESAPQPIMDVLFFSMRGTRTRGNRSNYRKLLSEETLLDEISLQNAMLNRDYWKTIAR